MPQIKSQAAFFSHDIDLKVVAEHNLTIYAPGVEVGFEKFYINEVGIIVTQASNVTVQPTVRFGIPSAPAKIVSAFQTVDLTETTKRERWLTLLSDDGETALSCGVLTGATADILIARFYFQGFFL